MNALEATVNRTECDAVVTGRPIDLNRIIKIDKPDTRVYYNLQEIGRPNFEIMLDGFVNKHLKILRISHFNFLPQNAANPPGGRINNS